MVWWRTHALRGKAGGTAAPARRGGLRLEHIWKAFGPLQVLSDASLSAEPGEIHAIVGENGAGKTTLVRILAGLERADEGSVEISGVALRPGHSPKEALDAGAGLVPQHCEVVPGLSVLENLVLGSEPSSAGLLRRDDARRRAEEIASRLGFRFDWNAPADALGLGQRQGLELVRLLWRDSSVLALDEPTTVLNPDEVKGLFDALRALAAEGRTVLFISHILEEVSEIADDATVLRGGRVVGRVPRREIDPRQLARLMVGEVESPHRGNAAPHTRPVALRLTNVSTRVLGSGDRPLRGVSLEVAGGEIVGIAGVEGNGQNELAEVMLGLRRCDAGSVELAGKAVAAHSPAERRVLGLASIPADRMEEGVNLLAPLWENVTAQFIAAGQASRFGIIRRRELRTRAKHVLDRAGVQGDIDLPARALSGGNIQRLIVARELAANPKVVVAAHPTRGVDVRGMAFIHQQLLDLRDAGCAVLLISAHLDELAQLADRIYVLQRGRIAGTYVPGEADAAQIGLLMSGAASQPGGVS